MVGYFIERSNDENLVAKIIDLSKNGGIFTKMILNTSSFTPDKKKIRMEMPGIEPGASHMQSERSTTELHPHCEIFHI